MKKLLLSCLTLLLAATLILPMSAAPSYANAATIMLLQQAEKEKNQTPDTSYDGLTLESNHQCAYRELKPRQYGNVYVNQGDVYRLAYAAEELTNFGQNFDKLQADQLLFLRNLSSLMANREKSSLFLSPYQAIALCNLSTYVLGQDIVGLPDLD